MIDYEVTPPVGIDLGTTNSLIARYKKRQDNIGEPIVYVQNALGNGKQFPSMVFAENNSEFTLSAGISAFTHRYSRPQQVASSIKRKIGNDKFIFKLLGREFTSSELWKIVVRDIFKDPKSTYLKMKPSSVVVTIPYDFGEIEKLNTIKSIELALKELYPVDTPELLELLPEPVAAGLYIVHEIFLAHTPIDSQNLLVFDWGGGTLDATLINFQISGTEIQFEVLATDGKLDLGGDDISFALERVILERTGFSYSSVDKNMKDFYRARVLGIANDAKEWISNKQGNYDVNFIGPLGQLIRCTIEPEDLKNILNGQNNNNLNFFEEIGGVISNTLFKAEKKKGDVDTILFIGGSSRVLGLRDYVKSIFPINVVIFNESGVNSDDTELIYESVVKGASIYCALEEDNQHGKTHRPFGLEVEKVRIVKRSSHALYVKLSSGDLDMVLKENNIIPIQIKKNYFPIPKNSLKEMINLPPLTIIEKKGEQENIIGHVPFPEFYRHNRKLKDIDIQVEFDCSATNLGISVVIKNSDKNNKDITISKAIKYQI